MVIFTKRVCEFYVPAASALMFLGALGVAFFVLPPVVLVTDIYFSAIYGEKYEMVRRLEASIALRKQIRLVRVAGDTDNLSITEAVLKAAKRPAAVFYTSAYTEAAKYYAANHSKSEEGALPPVPVFLLTDRYSVQNEEPGLILVRPDFRTDFYRAALCAAILTRETVPLAEGADPELNDIRYKSIGVVYDAEIPSEIKDFIQQGAIAGGWEGSVRYYSTDDNGSLEGSASLIFYGGTAMYVQSGADYPAVLFSWFSNTNYMPENIKITIDDSPYTVMPEAFRQGVGKSASSVTVPSRLSLYETRIANALLIPELVGAIINRPGDKPPERQTPPPVPPIEDDAAE